MRPIEDLLTPFGEQIAKGFVWAHLVVAGVWWWKTAWLWLVTPLGVPAISFAHALGLALFTRSAAYGAQRGASTGWKIVLEETVRQVWLWTLLCLVHVAMGSGW